MSDAFAVARRPTVTQRAKVAALALSATVLEHAPELLLDVLASAGGMLLYLAQRRRRRLVRDNLRRVCRHLGAGSGANETVSAAAASPRALERLVQAAFRHYVRGYLEAAALARYAAPAALERVAPDDRGLAHDAFAPAQAGAPLIIVGMHFGAIEIPALWAIRQLGISITAPMETVLDPARQAYFARSRAATGLTIIPLEHAAPQLRRELALGHAVALVADRPLAGSGTPVELFGAPARLPIGPAVLAFETGAPAWLITIRRDAGAYRGRLERIDLPPTGSRRDRLAAFMRNEARAFERAVADAPEQWWATFFPIWQPPDGQPTRASGG